MSKESKADLLRKEIISTKLDLLNSIANAKKSISDPNGDYTKRTIEFHEIMKKMINRFYERVQFSKLFEELEDWWGYSYVIAESGIRLYLCHYPGVGYFEEYGGYLPADADEQYLLIEEKTKMLSVEEYAERCSVEPVTVRQWIRRGKLVGATKVGKEWQIPELTERDLRSYTPRSYKWKKDTIDWPEKYSFLENSESLTIYRSYKDHHVFIIEYFDEGFHKEGKTISADERATFEMFLMTNPMVAYEAEVYITHF